MDTLFAPILAYTKKRGFSSERVQKAYDLASRFHEGQKRKSGDPYLTHVLAVTNYLVQYDADEDSLIAGLLHDAVEDTECTIEDIERLFGHSTAVLIDGLTKFSKKDFLDANNLDRKIESLRKWFAVMQKDIRVAIIKLFDRLHNMETLGYHGNSEKERSIAKETLDVHVKIAAKLGLFQVKYDLEQYSLPYFDPKAFQRIEVVKTRQREAALKILPELTTILQKKNTLSSPFDFYYSPLSPMKIYERELHLKEHNTATIPLSFVIVTDSIEHCYHFLYVIHNTWKAEPTYFHDYINSPKINGYRGLHTTIVTEDGRKVTFKIRTKEMDTYFKKGITTYCFQEGAQSFWLPRWISDLQYVTAEKRDHSQDFWEQLQHDILEESIMVYTNQGVTLLLPNHSTVLDAAFYAYRDKALFVDKILVNGDPVPLYHALRAYDSVFFSFSEESRVTNEWLQYVDTSLASTFVKEGLVKVDATAKIHIGKNALALELQKVGRGHIEELHPRSLAHLITTFQVDSLDHIYRKIGEGLLTATEVVQSITGYTHTPLSHTRSLLIEGPFAPILTLLHKIPPVFIRKMKWESSSKGTHCSLRCTFQPLTISEWKDIQTTLSRSAQLKVKILDRQTFWKRNILVLSILSLSLLWAFDPIIATSLLTTHGVPPLFLTSLRFYTVLLFLFFFLLYTHLRRNPHNQPKQLPFFSFDIFVISLLLFATAYCSYMALQGTTSSTYILVIRCFGWFSIFFALIRLKRLSFSLFWISTALFLLGYTLLFIDPFTPWHTSWKIWTILASLSFASYSWLGQRYRSKVKILWRYQYYQFFIHLYAALWGTVALLLAPHSFSLPSPQILLLCILFAIIFTGLPHLLFAYLIRTIKDTTYLFGFALSGVFLLTLSTELFFFQTYPSLFKILAIFAIYISLGVLYYSYHHLGAKKEE